MGLLDYLEQARQRMLNTGTGLLNSRAAMDSVMPEVRAQGESEIMNHPGMQWAGLLGTMAGIGAKTADLVKLAAAQKMEKAGTAPEKIWQATGWGRSPGDGQWRFEIPDNPPNAMRLLGPKGGTQEYTPLEETLVHPQLKEAYPGIGGAQVTWRPENTSLGSYVRNGPFEYVNMNSSLIGDQKGSYSTMLHELQHAIQQREGFARGGSPEGLPQALQNDASAMRRQAQQAFAKDDRATGLALEKKAREIEHMAMWGEMAPYELYRRLAGEAEARMTQARMHLTPEERLANYPFQQGLLGYDVPIDQLITRFK